MEKIKSAFNKLWNSYKNWLGDVVWYKNWKVWFSVVVVLLIGAFGGTDEPETEAEPKEPETEEVAEKDNADLEEVKGSKDELPNELKDLRVTDVRNDATGNWKKVVDSKNFNMPENAITYAEEYMKEDEIHFLVSFATNTTTMINDLGGMLFVNITEYEEKEEHSADTIGNGMVLKSYNIYKDSGEIEDIENDEEENNEVSFESLISNTHIDSYQIDDNTGIVIVQAPIDGIFSGESAVESFNQEMWMTLQEYNELFPDGVFYLGYGDINGEELYKLAAQFNGETLSQIDFDKVILDSESIIYSDRYYISGFGDLDLDFPTSKEGDPLIEGDPVDELWFNETVGPKRELKNK